MVLIRIRLIFGLSFGFSVSVLASFTSEVGNCNNSRSLTRTEDQAMKCIKKLILSELKEHSLNILKIDKITLDEKSFCFGEDDQRLEDLYSFAGTDEHKIPYKGKIHATVVVANSSLTCEVVRNNEMITFELDPIRSLLKYGGPNDTDVREKSTLTDLK